MRPARSGGHLAGHPRDPGAAGSTGAHVGGPEVGHPFCCCAAPSPCFSTQPVLPRSQPAAGAAQVRCRAGHRAAAGDLGVARGRGAAPRARRPRAARRLLPPLLAPPGRRAAGARPPAHGGGPHAHDAVHHLQGPHMRRPPHACYKQVQPAPRARALRPCGTPALAPPPPRPSRGGRGARRRSRRRRCCACRCRRCA